MTSKKNIQLLLGFSIAVVLSYFLTKGERFWVPLTALLVLQAPVGSIVRHGIRIFLLVLFSVIIFTYLFQPTYLLMRANNIMIGAIIGILTNLFVFPVKPDVLFRQQTILIFRSYSEYLLAICDLLTQSDVNLVNRKREAVEDCLCKYNPDWVYKPGFNVALREGHRHFLLMTERVGQILFSMHRSARFSFNEELRDMAKESLIHSIERIRQMFTAIMTVLELKKWHGELADIEENIAELDAVSQTFLPASIELMDLSKEYLAFTALIYDLRDLRMTLLRLIEALRE